MALVDYYREVAASPFSSPQARALAQEFLSAPRGMGANDFAATNSDFLTSSNANTSSNSASQNQVSNVTFAAPQGPTSLSDSPWAQVAIGGLGLLAFGAAAWKLLR